MRLLDEGLTSVTEYAQEGRPNKKVYSLTADGRMALLRALQEPTEPDKTRSDFLLRMMFADIVPPSAVEQMIDIRLQEIEDNLDRIRARSQSGQETTGEAFLNGFAAAVQRAMADYIEENRYQLVASSLIPKRAVAE